MKKIIYLLMAFVFAGLMQSSAMAADNSSDGSAKKERTFQTFHKKLSKSCGKCHVNQKEGEELKEATTFSCTDCHGTPDEMAQDSSDKGLKGPHNPHQSIHFGTTLPCEECHKEHEKPSVYCEGCHRTFKYSIPGEDPKRQRYMDYLSSDKK